MSFISSSKELKLAAFNCIYECNLTEKDMLLVDTILYFKKRCDLPVDIKINGNAESVYTLCGLFIEHRDDELKQHLANFIILIQKTQTSFALTTELNCIISTLHASNLLIPCIYGKDL